MKHDHLYATKGVKPSLSWISNDKKILTLDDSLTFHLDGMSVKTSGSPFNTSGFMQGDSKLVPRDVQINTHATIQYSNNNFYFLIMDEKIKFTKHIMTAVTTVWKLK